MVLFEVNASVSPVLLFSEGSGFPLRASMSGETKFVLGIEAGCSFVETADDFCSASGTAGEFNVGTFAMGAASPFEAGGDGPDDGTEGKEFENAGNAIDGMIFGCCNAGLRNMLYIFCAIALPTIFTRPVAKLSKPLNATIGMAGRPLVIGGWLGGPRL